MVRGRVENWVVARERFSIWILFSVHARQRTSLGLKGSSQGYCGLDRSHFGGSCVCSRCGAVWRCGGEAGCGGVFVAGRSAKRKWGREALTHPRRSLGRSLGRNLASQTFGNSVTREQILEIRFHHRRVLYNWTHSIGKVTAWLKWFVRRTLWVPS